MNDNQIYKGILFVTGDNNCWMNIQNERIEDETIEIECDNLIDKLFDHVPCRIGDNYLYESQSEISDKLINEGDKTVLGNIDKIRIIRDDDEFELLL